MLPEGSWRFAWPQHPDEGGRGDAARRHPGRVEEHPHLAPLAADDPHLRDVGDRFHLVVELRAIRRR